MITASFKLVEVSAEATGDDVALTQADDGFLSAHKTILDTKVEWRLWSACESKRHK